MTMDCHDGPETCSISFEDESSRIGFIRKVLAIKLLQSLAVTTVMLVFLMDSGLLERVMRDPDTRMQAMAFSSLQFVGMLGLIHFCNDARFVKPLNYIFLLGYLLSAAFFTSVVTWHWGLNVIFISWVHLNFALVALLRFAFQSKFEFRTNFGVFLSAGIFILSYVLSLKFIYGTSAFKVLYCSLVMYLLIVYMLIVIQDMTSKTYRIRLTPSDYVKAALIIHIEYRYMILQFYKKCTTRSSHVAPSVNIDASNRLEDPESLRQSSATL